MSESTGNTIYDKLTPQRKQLVDEILKNLESGVGLWQQGWQLTGVPISAITGKRYNGVNRLFLTAATMSRGYKDNRWLTYKQMEEKGWSFKKDEEGNNLGKGAGVPIEYFELRDRETKKPFDSHTLDGMTEDDKDVYMDENVYPLRKYYRVFNGEIIDGIPEREKRELDPNGYSERAENILQLWSDTESKIIYGGDEAFYRRSSDEIHLPEKKMFNDLPEFYATALHEVGHSTGHKSRLNRNLEGAFGSEEYAKEELCAEIASMFIEQDLEIAVGDKHIQNNSAYIQHWKKKIKEDPNVLFKAIADAERITKFVMAKEEEVINAEEREEQIVEEKSAIYIPPSEVATQVAEAAAIVGTVTSVESAGKGIESLTNMHDRDIVERASKTKHGEKFLSLFNGESVLGDEQKDERSLMARLAMMTSGNEEQLLRIFRASGQFRADKPNSYYEKMAKEEMKFVASLKAKIPVAASGNASGSRFANAK